MTTMVILTMSRQVTQTPAWTVAEAKAKLGQVIEQARAGPQMITRNGRPAAVVVSAEEWEQRTSRSGNLAEFLAASPLRGSGLKTERSKDQPRGPGQVRQPSDVLRTYANHSWPRIRRALGSAVALTCLVCIMRVHRQFESGHDASSRCMGSFLHRRRSAGCGPVLAPEARSAGTGRAVRLARWSRRADAPVPAGGGPGPAVR